MKDAPSALKTVDRIREDKDLVSKEQLDLRVQFAQAIAAQNGEPFVEALLKYTDMHQRLCGRRPHGMPDAGWINYAAAVRSLPAEALLDATFDFAQHFPPQRDWIPAKNYGAFSYGYDDAAAKVLMSFAVSFPEVDLSKRVLGEEQTAARLEDLGRMFADIKHEHPDAKTVEGISWLYNLKAYCDLFPPSYNASKKVFSRDFNGLLRWGQFIDKNGKVNEERKTQFLENIQHLDINDLAKAFPLPTWHCETSIEDFYNDPRYQIGTSTEG